MIVKYHPFPGLQDRMISSRQLTTRQVKKKIEKLRAQRRKLEAELLALDEARQKRAAECAALFEVEEHLQEEIDGR